MEEGASCGSAPALNLEKTKLNEQMETIIFK
jgi:hypothetical protein